MRWIVTGWSSDPENGLCGHFLARQGTEGSLTETLPSTKTQLFLSTCAPWSGFFSKLSSLVSDLLPQKPNSAFASANFVTANWSSSLVCAAEICVRIRAFPIGTTGYENAMT